jgi:hypothetical protein
MAKDRAGLANHPAATLPAVRLFDQLHSHPIVTLATALKLLKVTKPQPATPSTPWQCSI